ncbi:imidazoleglycerol-phosphate dehydratase [Clostridiales bacterium PH28_bin88]|nr:imidazoleglycerol-phosphate dehydratase [Clostridiales bacterium PH28_bin88]
MNREASVKRKTAETDIELRLVLDGSGRYQVDTGIGFLDHMLALWCRHGLFDLEVKALGDLAVDGHHTVEDVGICLGRAIKEGLGERAGITRYGHAMVPMDEALVLVALDLSGRPFLAYQADIPAERVGDLETELVEEFLRALSVQGGITLHVRVLAGRNSHHTIEAIFKALGRALREAVQLDPHVQGVMSTKETLV